MVGVRIDLHVHSTASDGTDTPDALVAAAAAAGLDVVALTDHDTTAGWDLASAALPPGLRLVPGAELSCVSPDGRGGQATVHLLAYLFDPDSPAVVAEQTRLRLERRERLRRMAERMAADGFPVDADELMAALPTGATAGRPHLARALVAAGVVSSVDEAFARYLGTGGPYYLGRTDTPVHTAIDMIAEAGGVTVLAHPFARTRGPVVTPEVVVELAGRGLAGLEVDHPDQDAPTRAELRALATDLDLIITGSSDYHGTNKTVRLGQETTAPEAFERLLDRAGADRVVTG
ncbi:PHP domain-containing protein [Streptoalloteichus tenebrarius]|uniref:PHP domain-containing protein n=1 Tax=Streptoalloteichus tenebrarius (strain ATCC 17920 / DSM 40477 / JCM 4838 / CBS 697.72 / NBRC 16177 / NCIMB 11028 / NRRL B-12390 / A12253. 1 / ISP 5477) TaxID=1933 RepID=UPI0020A49AF5|nr:PHP domain-containing protein [Streptoalloteichus tenebrarius]